MCNVQFSPKSSVRLNDYILGLLGEHFLKKLDVEEGNSGRTYIDNMVTACMWELTCESKEDWSGHGGADMQHILFGSMGGKLRSGNYYALPRSKRDGVLHNNTLLITFLKLMGIPPSEYSQYSSIPGGFGYYKKTLGGNRDIEPIHEILT